MALASTRARGGWGGTGRGGTGRGRGRGGGGGVVKLVQGLNVSQSERGTEALG